jgi:hypothetical protein
VSENVGAENDVSQNEPDGEREAARPPEPAEYRLRRAPKYLPFGITGALLGVAVGLVLALAFPISGDYSERAIIGYFAAILALVGSLAGLGVAVLIERRH